MEFTAHFVTYQGTYCDVETDKLNVPTTDGRRTILANHMPIMMPIEIGVVETARGGKPRRFAVTEGVMMFENNEATILCDEIVDVEQINKEKALKALEKAQERLEQGKKSSDILRAKIALRRAASLIDLADKYKD